MSDCIFCNIAHDKYDKAKIYEDDQIFVVKDIHPKAKVHLLVIPKLHIDNLFEAHEEHSLLLGYLITSLKNFAKEQGLSSFKTLVNTGGQSGQEIAHLHFHLLSDS